MDNVPYQELADICIEQILTKNNAYVDGPIYSNAQTAHYNMSLEIYCNTLYIYVGDLRTSPATKISNITFDLEKNSTRGNSYDISLMALVRNVTLLLKMGVIKYECSQMDLYALATRPRMYGVDLISIKSHD